MSVDPGRVCIVLLLPLLAGCQGDRARSAAPACEDLRAAEAAFIEYLWSNNHSGVGRRAGAVFIALPGPADPEPGFLERLSGIPVPVRPASHAHVDERGTVREPETGAPALIFRIERSRLAGTGRAEIFGGYDEASLSASRSTYTLLCTADRWQVTDVGPMMISDAGRPRAADHAHVMAYRRSPVSGAPRHRAIGGTAWQDAESRRNLHNHALNGAKQSGVFDNPSTDRCRHPTGARRA